MLASLSVLLLTAQGEGFFSRRAAHNAWARRRRRRRGGVEPLSAAGRLTAGSRRGCPRQRPASCRRESRCTRRRRSPAHRAAPGTCVVCAVSPATLCTRKTSSRRAAAAAPAASMPASSQRRRHGEGATITCHPRRRARPALPGEGEELHVRPVPRRAARGLVPARCGAGGAQGRGGTGRHLRKRAAPNVQYSRFEAPITLQSRSPFFFDLFASRGFIEGAYCAYEGPQRPPGAASRPLACRRRAAPGNAPVHPTRAPPTPSTRHLLPPVAKEQN